MYMRFSLENRGIDKEIIENNIKKWYVVYGRSNHCASGKEIGSWIRTIFQHAKDLS